MTKLIEGVDVYIRMTCSHCDSTFAVDYVFGETEGNVLYCPFCGDEIDPENEIDNEKDDEPEEPLYSEFEEL